MASSDRTTGSCLGSRKIIPRHDIFAYNPHYEWTSHKTWVGMILSYLTISFLLFYMGITTRDYVVRPPELVSQGDIDLLEIEREIPFRLPVLGLRVGYTNDTSDPVQQRVQALANENPYVRFEFRHVAMRNQERVRETKLDFENCIVNSIPSVCPVVNASFPLQGTYFKESYQFLEILINKCTNKNDINSCAPLSQINDRMQSGDFRVRAQVSVESEQFDVERFHATGTGFTISNRSFIYYNLPGVEVQSDVILQARRIAKEQRYLGSPPLPETEINVLSMRGQPQTSYRPRTVNETNLMTLVVRLADNVQLEEVSYWCPSILDLFALWGAMASFAMSLSLGFIAYEYNKYQFHKHFKKAALQKRREANQQTRTLLKWWRNKKQTQNNDNIFPSTSDRPNRDEIMYNNLQAQLDALMIVPDLRLFDTHHFTQEGRVAITAEELKYPSTAFGELRRLAIQEHCKKKRAAQFLSVWYGRHLVQRGFIPDPERQRELFAPNDDDDWDSASRNHAWSGGDDREQPPSLRRRRPKLPSRGKFLIYPSSRQRKSKQRILEQANNNGDSSSNDDNSDGLEPRTTLDNSGLDAMEKGEGGHDDRKTKTPSQISNVNDDSFSSPSQAGPFTTVPSGNTAGGDTVEQELDHYERQTALDVIAAMDFGSPTK